MTDDDSFPLPIEMEARIDRHLIGTAFVGILVGLAYQEAADPVRESLNSKGITLGTMALSSMFFFAALYRFISSYVSLAIYRGVLWFVAFLGEILASVVLIFMAGLCTEEANLGVRYTFLDYLVLYYILDLASRILLVLITTATVAHAIFQEEGLWAAVAPLLGVLGLWPFAIPLLLSLWIRSRMDHFQTSALFFILIIIQFVLFAGTAVMVSRGGQLFLEEGGND